MLIDFSRASTSADVDTILAPVLAGGWPAELVVKGLDHLERTLPDDAHRFLEAVGDYNDETEEPRCAVRVTPDYRCSMFYLLFEAVPTPGAELSEGGVKGAMICCWIKTDSAREAHRLARDHIEESGWLIVKQEEIHPAAREDFRDEAATGLAMYEQACIDGMVFELHMWTNDEEPEEPEGSDERD